MTKQGSFAWEQGVCELCCFSSVPVTCHLLCWLVVTCAGYLSPVLVTCHLSSTQELGAPLLQLAGKCPESEQKVRIHDKSCTLVSASHLPIGCQPQVKCW